jgi:hypothetical protein
MMALGLVVALAVLVFVRDETEERPRIVKSRR